MRWWDLEAVMGLEGDLFGAEQWSTSMFWSELAERATRHYLVAYGQQDADVTGYAGLCTYGQEAYVQTLAVRRDQQGTGIGRTLLQALLTEADRRGATSVALEVRADNAVAQRLYAEHAFAPVGRRRGYYQPSGVDAVVMIRGG
jgi:ribosomal-protein-alanine N-acetyltransferase